MSGARGAPLPVAILGLAVAAMVVTVGTFWAFDRGALDFRVFYHAWSLVLGGQGHAIYVSSPDRFLYAPGFAFLFAPLAWLPFELALAVWCFAKAACVGYVVREFQPDHRGGLASMGWSAWGVALLARPLLIDFQYGQVNTLILGVCVWALLGHVARSSEGRWVDFVRWFLLGIAAAAKVFPLPLVAVPWLVVPAGIDARKLRLERAGVIVGLLTVLLLPVLFFVPGGAWALLGGWREALFARGLPFESHNQSFSAMLHRWFSGAPVHVVALGMHSVRMGWSWMSETTFRLLALSWIAVSGGVALAWLMRAGREVPLRWIAVMVALLVLPSHLVWKPYFVMFLPAGVLAVRGVRGPWRWGVLVAAFCAMNLSGFDLLGADWGARAESASVMLWAALAYLGLLRATRRSQASTGAPPEARSASRRS